MERFKYGKEGTFVPLNPKDPLNRGVNQKSDKVVTMIAIGITITVLMFFFSHKFIMDITQFGFITSLIIIAIIGIIITSILVISVYADRDTLRSMSIRGTIKNETVERYWGIQPDGVEESEGIEGLTTIQYDDGRAMVLKMVNGSTSAATDDADREFYSVIEEIYGTLAGINGITFLSIDMPHNIDSDKIWKQEAVRLERASHAGKDFIDRKFIEQSYRYDFAKNHRISNTILIIKFAKSTKMTPELLLQRLFGITMHNQVMRIKGCSQQELTLIMEDYYNTPIDIGIGNYDIFNGEIALIKDVSADGKVVLDLTEPLNFKIKTFYTNIGIDLVTLDEEEEESNIGNLDIYSDIII